MRDIKGGLVLPGGKNAHKLAVQFQAGSAIDKGDILVATGAGARLLELSAADSGSAALSIGVLYLAMTNAKIGQYSKALPLATITGVDTSAGAVGDPVFLSTTGGWSLSASGSGRQVGHIIVDSATVGEIAFCGYPGAGGGGGVARSGITTVLMGDAAHELTLGPAGAGETQLVGNLVFVDAESASTEDLTLPAPADSAGIVLDIYNFGGEDVDLLGPGAVGTVAAGTGVRAASNGTVWGLV